MNTSIIEIEINRPTPQNSAIFVRGSRSAALFVAVARGKTFVANEAMSLSHYDDEIHATSSVLHRAAVVCTNRHLSESVSQLKFPHFRNACQTILPIKLVDDRPHDKSPSARSAGILSPAIFPDHFSGTGKWFQDGFVRFFNLAPAGALPGYPLKVPPLQPSQFRATWHDYGTEALGSYRNEPYLLVSARQARRMAAADGAAAVTQGLCERLAHQQANGIPRTKDS
jgi:hypothetical protein